MSHHIENLHDGSLGVPRTNEGESETEIYITFSGLWLCQFTKSVNVGPTYRIKILHTCLH